MDKKIEDYQMSLNEIIRFGEWMKTDRLFFVDEVRGWLKMFHREEISFSKFVELFNQKVFEKYAKASNEIKTTVGEILSAKIALHELNPVDIEHMLNFPQGILEKLMRDEYYTNSVPVILFRNLLVALNVPYEEIEKVMIQTFKTVQSKETEETIKNKPGGYLLWENEESVRKYTAHLKEIWNNPLP